MKAVLEKTETSSEFLRSSTQHRSSQAVRITGTPKTFEANNLCWNSILGQNLTAKTPENPAQAAFRSPTCIVPEGPIPRNFSALREDLHAGNLPQR